MNEQANMAIRYEREIPEGYEARIEGNKVIIELKESKDERIRKAISYAICAAAHQDGTLINDVTKDEAIAYLERQKEQKPRDESGTAEPDYGICDSYIPAALHHALKRHGWYVCHIGEDDEIIKERRDYVARNWPADKDTLTQDQQPAEWSKEGYVRVYEPRPGTIIDKAISDTIEEARKIGECLILRFNGVCLSIEKNSNPDALKSMYYRRWKPSEEQMRCLLDCVSKAKEIHNASVGGYDAYRILVSLYNDLQKLL